MCYPLDQEINILIGEEVKRVSGKSAGEYLRLIGIEPGEPVPVLSPCQKRVSECLVLSPAGECSWLPVALVEVIRE
jgi:hypothetical protein